MTLRTTPVIVTSRSEATEYLTDPHCDTIGAVSIFDRFEPTPPRGLGHAWEVLRLSYFDDGINGVREATRLSRDLVRPDLFRQTIDALARERGWISIPTVDMIIAFGRKFPNAFAREPGPSLVNGRVLFHCFAGHSRSTSAALACFADAFGPGNEDAAVERLLESSLDPTPQPSLLTVAIADFLLARDGALVRAVVKAGLV